MATMEALGSSCTRGEISLPANAGRASGGVFQLVVNISVESAGHIGPSVIDGVVRVRRNINIERLVVPNTPSAHVDGGMSPSEPGKALRVQGVEHIIKGVTVISLATCTCLISFPQPAYPSAINSASMKGIL